ncbi:putative 60S ribosomal protein L13 [Filobasidium floriforme]|uniref:putative 60S ribosomal protein L13 n=1 Tax=Filobasidium floriforme TaxID=5210 RepID=UPI001E8EA5FC|nr:putative 60S ribosomal protein L13 [Filobasidium floriforme]KAH8079008.1 putative 60S ribosomal protein L13 [Filobasidium floriforme]
MVAHNNQLANEHFRKSSWQERVKTWFDQPGRKHSRRVARQKKALNLGVRPLQLLRPAVRAPTQRYNTKVRLGRGFTLSELKQAGVPRKEAKGLGIVIDHRRNRRSEESEKVNVERLKEYRSRLIVFPKKAGKAKKGDSSAEELKADTTRVQLALPNVYEAEAPRAITEEEKNFDAFLTLRRVRADKRNAGQRKKRADAKAAEEAASKK